MLLARIARYGQAGGQTEPSYTWAIERTPKISSLECMSGNVVYGVVAVELRFQPVRRFDSAPSGVSFVAIASVIQVSARDEYQSILIS